MSEIEEERSEDKKLNGGSDGGEKSDAEEMSDTEPQKGMP